MEKKLKHEGAKVRLLTAVFVATLFLSATLLFSIQPLAGKLLLPLLGGAPSVWNTVMVFFQAMLLAGYSYAHFSTRRFGLRNQSFGHLILVLLAASCLPFVLKSNGNASMQIEHPAFWALTTLTLTLGLPVFVLASTAPLMQKWFASTKHPLASDPYFLYAASNLGSFGALFAYPLVIEPYFRLQTQTLFWSYGFWAFAVCLMVCTWLRQISEAPRPKTTDEQSEGIPRITVLKWIGLSFLPSSLMLGVTNYITTDVASIPLLWVLPLAAYLFTFVIAFGKYSKVAEKSSSRALSILALAVVFPLLVQATEPVVILLLLHLAFFFVAALQCHLKLARSRPPTNQLTAFYLYLSLGGVLGGIFNALIAPMIFSSVAEYPLAIVAATLVGFPERMNRKTKHDLPSVYGGAFVILGMVVGSAVVAMVAPANILAGNIIAGVLLLCSYFFIRRPVRYALAIGTLLLCTSVFRHAQSGVIERKRNFFGLLRVSNDPDKPLRRLFHGTTIHGVQFRIPERQCEPLSYYHSDGPVAEIAQLFERTQVPRNVALVGLGAGAIITYSKPGQDWTLYEIDPAVVQIARDPTFFTYLSQCAHAPYKFELGDARLRLVSAPDKHFGLIFLDAFSSDVIPMHLLTIEALKLYEQKLAPGGIMAFHLSSRHFELEPLVARLGEQLQLDCYASTRGELSQKALAEGGLDSNWVILVPRELGPLVAKQVTWHKIKPDPRAPLWTDDFSSLLGVLRLQ